MCAVPWGVISNVGVFSTVGDIMSAVGDILSTMEGVQYRGGYHEYRGVILSTVGDIMMHVGDIMSTVGVFSTVGDTIL